MVVSILVVDDEPDVALLFRQCFRHEIRDGTYVMHFANSGEDALHLLRAGMTPHLILSDINMPGMDGLTLLGTIKRQFPDLPMMMVTAYDDNERKRRASDLGACEFLGKPGTSAISERSYVSLQHRSNEQDATGFDPIMNRPWTAGELLQRPERLSAGFP